MNKVAITMDNYKQIMLKRAIITCWIVLIICFIIKIFGGNFFAIVCNNERFIKVCEYIDNSILRYIEGYITYIESSLILLLIISDDKRVFTINNLLYLISCTLYWAIKILIELNVIEISTLLYNIIDFAILYILLIIFGRKYLYSLIAIALMLIFTIISAITKNIGIDGSITESSVVANIFLIDYYIMLILTYLYSIKLRRRY